LATDGRRRRLLQLAAATTLAPLASRAAPAQPRGPIVNDVSKLNAIEVAAEARPASLDELVSQLRGWPGPVSVGGGRFSMGGQVALRRSLHIDTRAMNRVVRFDPASRLIRVQAGATWRDLQDVIDPHGLSVKIMQSYSNFTVGGSVSVNCHGRYVGRGPLVNSVRALQLVTADGQVYELSRESRPELFAACFGGYGGLGIVTEAELELDDNTRIERRVESVSLEDYTAFFKSRVQGDPAMVLHNADLTPPDFDAPRCISWLKTDKPLTQPLRLVPRGLDYTREQSGIWAITELPGGSVLRKGVERQMLGAPAVVWRNHEASMDAASLEPSTRAFSTYLLQEYFIPVGRFVDFARAMASILKARAVNALNVSVRHSPRDSTALLTWAPTEVFSFVLYYKQRATRRSDAAAAAWTRELIEAALRNGGRYYLPYRLHATPEQFRRAYPEVARFNQLKLAVDPRNRFRNLLWDRYLGL
jgi:FAD/FMN-containing dehydrogenase